MNNKGADQTEHMRRLVCTFVVFKPPKTGFLALRPILFSDQQQAYGSVIGSAVGNKIYCFDTCVYMYGKTCLKRPLKN